MDAKTLLGVVATVAIQIAFAMAKYDVAKYCQLVTPGTKLPSLISKRTYYTCQANGNPIQANCTGSTEFSKNARNCVPTVDDMYNPCEGKDHEFAPSNKGCNMWNYCVNGSIAGYGSCFYKQIFDPNNSSCIYGTCGDANDEAPDVQNICNIMPDGQFFGDLKDCSAWNKCNGLKLEKGNCLNDLVFDTTTAMCLTNDGNMCERTKDITKKLEGGAPSETCTSSGQVVGDTEICSVYYVCQPSDSSSELAFKWIQHSCNKEYFDVITKKCSSISLARPYPGCDRCQFKSGNLYWVNAVSPNCSQYITCNKGQMVGTSQGSCGPGNYFNEASQYCIEGDYDLGEYALQNGACQDYFCNKARVCSLATNGGENREKQ